jgi:nitrogen regulatory protein PII
MKFIVAVIKPFKLDEVRDARGAVGIQGITVTEVKGHGRQRGHAEFYRGAEYTVSFVPKVEIELAGEAAIAGLAGDGKIFVPPLDQAVRIRTGETGAAAP